jgi:hypothetical protein
MDAKQRRKKRREERRDALVVAPRLERQCVSPVPVSTEEVVAQYERKWNRREKVVIAVGAAVAVGGIGWIISALLVLL